MDLDPQQDRKLLDLPNDPSSSTIPSPSKDTLKDPLPSPQDTSKAFIPTGFGLSSNEEEEEKRRTEERTEEPIEDEETDDDFFDDDSTFIRDLAQEVRTSTEKDLKSSRKTFWVLLGVFVFITMMIILVVFLTRK